jgi:hypothetical protein
MHVDDLLGTVLDSTICWVLAELGHWHKLHVAEASTIYCVIHGLSTSSGACRCGAVLGTTSPSSSAGGFM